jgi:hypothetical protein
VSLVFDGFPLKRRLMMSALFFFSFFDFSGIFG